MVKLPSSSSLSIVMTGRQLVGGEEDEDGGREVALVEGVDWEELGAGDASELSDMDGEE